MLYALRLHLDPAGPGRIRPIHGDHGHGLFLHLLRETAPELATVLHNVDGTQPYTVGLSSGTDHRSIELRLTLLRDEVAEPAIALLRSITGKKVRLGDTLFLVGDVSAARHPVGGIPDY